VGKFAPQQLRETAKETTMKKLAICLLALTLTACSGGTMTSPQAQGSQSLQKIAVCLLGDSRTARGDWPHLLPGYSVTNAGIESQLASEIFARLDTDCSGKGIVIVNAGTNDAIRTGDMRSAEATIQAFADAHPQLVLSTVPRVDNASVQAHIDELNAWLRLYAMSSKHQLLDFAAAVDPCATCISTDAIHYTPLGYQKIAAVISQSVH
jgi:lysophospholipase L1-like esterase